MVQAEIIVFVGRLETDTGLLKFLNWLKKNKEKKEVHFCGDGSFREECGRWGIVHGFCDPKPFLKKASVCVPGGYLSFIEAKKAGCKIKIFFDNPLKKDYWQEIMTVKKFPSWNQIADEYLDLYHHP